MCGCNRVGSQLTTCELGCAIQKWRLLAQPKSGLSCTVSVLKVSRTCWASSKVRQARGPYLFNRRIETAHGGKSNAEHSYYSLGFLRLTWRSIPLENVLNHCVTPHVRTVRPTGVAHGDRVAGDQGGGQGLGQIEEGTLFAITGKVDRPKTGGVNFKGIANISKVPHYVVMALAS